MSQKCGIACGFGKRHPKCNNHPENTPIISKQELRTIYGKIPCREGLNCSNMHCSFKHPHGWSRNAGDTAWMHNIPCRYGDNCNNSICSFGHSEKWFGKWIGNEKSKWIDEPCPYGTQCHIEHCAYNHTY